MTVYGQIQPIKITLIYIGINQMIALLLKKVLLLKEGACYSRLYLSNTYETNIFGVFIKLRMSANRTS